MKPQLRFAALVLFLLLLLPLGNTAALAEQALYPGIVLDETSGEAKLGLVRSEGVQVVYIKVATGEQTADAAWEQHYRLAREYAFRIGFSQELTAQTVKEAQAQARYFAALLENKNYDCLPALQLRGAGGLSPAMLSKIVLAYQQTMLDATGYPALIYAAPEIVRQLSPSLNVFPLWLAQPNHNSPDDLGSWEMWAAREEIASGSLTGLTGEVRLHRFTAEVFLHAPGKAHIGILVISALLLLAFVLTELTLRRKRRQPENEIAA